ncbi:MAG: nitrate/sulfonate/bicarbonate ABC transporter ATP-binding protein [Deltaproteobacteria bacterium]|nr:nitrate/sulfonate/bicarbonate ABC transporter ATP-binding protein [Deltaproteobacteria bacterium]
MEEPLIELKNINHTFSLSSGQRLKVLRDINLSINPGEIISILGPSGSGKSTCLRIMAGLIKPTSGRVLVQGKGMRGPNPLVSMVFQSFALLPWLTVFQNVALGLEPEQLPQEEVDAHVRKVLDLVGLEGFEEAYPRELSGGMKQRVGIARALVMERPVLFLDEPFSALDVLTAETLRKEVLDLWLSKRTSTQSLVIVTHNIIEAAALGRRILVMGTNPGLIRVSIKNELPYPRDEKSAYFNSLVANIHDVITEAIIPEEPEWVPLSVANTAVETIPAVQFNEMTGLLEFLSNHGGRADSFALAQSLGRDFGYVLFSAKAAELLDLVDTPKNMIVLTDLGRRFVAADVNMRKQIIHRALKQLRIIQLLEEKLQTSENKRLTADQAVEILHELIPNENPKQILDTIIEWGRYAELIGYSDDDKQLYLVEEEKKNEET